MQPVIALRSIAAKSGFSVLDLNYDEIGGAIHAGAKPGRYIRLHSTEESIIEVLAGSDDARRVTESLLAATSADQLGAFVSRYGSPGVLPVSVRDSLHYPVSELEKRADGLRRLLQACKTRDAATIRDTQAQALQPLLYFEFRFDVGSSSPGVYPKLITANPLAFCMLEVLGAVAANRSLVSCDQCGKMALNQKRADARFCSPRCRMAAHRAQKRRKLTTV
jgi:hypothetical protein